jgi:hypothetical protein
LALFPECNGSLVSAACVPRDSYGTRGTNTGCRRGSVSHLPLAPYLTGCRRVSLHSPLGPYPTGCRRGPNYSSSAFWDAAGIPLEDGEDPRVPLGAVADPSTRVWPHFPLDAAGPTQDGPTSMDVASPTQEVSASIDGGSYPCFKPRKPSLTWGLSTRKVTMISGKPIPTVSSPILANQAFSIGKAASQLFIFYFLLRNKPATPVRPRVHITKLPSMSSF